MTSLPPHVIARTSRTRFTGVDTMNVGTRLTPPMRDAVDDYAATHGMPVAVILHQALMRKLGVNAFGRPAGTPVKHPHPVDLADGDFERLAVGARVPVPFADVFIRGCRLREVSQSRFIRDAMAELIGYEGPR